MADKTDIATLYENLPDNSHKNRAEKSVTTEKKALPEGKRVDKVIQGKVKTKKNNVRKWTDTFISEDVSNVKNYILMDVIVPSIKKATYDLVVGAIDMILYGGNGTGRRPTSDKVSYRTDYSDISRRGERRYTESRNSSSTYNYDDIVLETRAEAETVLIRMDEIMAEYGTVRVADLYDLVGATGNYTDNNYGWTDIQSARVVHVPDGYKIKMPRAVALK